MVVAHLSGLWLSVYSFHSERRNETQTCRHTLNLLQSDEVIAARSLPDTGSTVLMDLTVDGHIINGNWTENTAKDGHYRGRRYHGVIRLSQINDNLWVGRWAGYGAGGKLNEGPWQLERVQFSGGQ